jgi:hypothetical protein
VNHVRILLRLPGFSRNLTVPSLLITRGVAFCFRSLSRVSDAVFV